MSKTSEVLSVQQAATELNIGRRAIIHRIKAGTLAAEKLGDGRTNAYVIARSEIEKAKGKA